MKFCPKCELRLKKNNSNSELSCPKCGYSESKSKDTKKDKEEEIKSEFNVLDENDQSDSQLLVRLKAAWGVVCLCESFIIISYIKFFKNL